MLNRCVFPAFVVPAVVGWALLPIENAWATTEPAPPTALVRRFQTGLFPPSGARESDYVSGLVQAMRLPDSASAKVVGVGGNSGLIFVNASSNYRDQWTVPVVMAKCQYSIRFVVAIGSKRPTPQEMLAATGRQTANLLPPTLSYGNVLPSAPPVTIYVWKYRTCEPASAAFPMQLSEDEADAELTKAFPRSSEILTR
jgi:hypothetical protein